MNVRLSTVDSRAPARERTVVPRRSTKSSSVTPRTWRLKVIVKDATGRADVAATPANVAASGGSVAGGAVGVGESAVTSTNRGRRAALAYSLEAKRCSVQSPLVGINATP